MPAHNENLVTLNNTHETIKHILLQIKAMIEAETLGVHEKYSDIIALIEQAQAALKETPEHMRQGNYYLLP